MKVEIKTTRECCEYTDLVACGGSPIIGRYPQWMFCKYCGRHHRGESQRDAAGSSEWGYNKMKFPWVEDRLEGHNC